MPTEGGLLTKIIHLLVDRGQCWGDVATSREIDNETLKLIDRFKLLAWHGQQACPCLSSRAVQAAGGQHCAVHWGVGHRGAAAQARRGKQAAAGTTFTLRGSRSSWITVRGVVGTPCNPPPWSAHPPPPLLSCL